MAVPRFVQECVSAAVERYPLAAAIVVVIIGTGAVIGSFVWAEKYEQFDGGARVVAQVIGAGEDAARQPRFAADVTWTTPGNLPWETVKHSAVVEVLQRQLPDKKAADPASRLRPGSEVPIVISKRGGDIAISAATLDDAMLFKIAGRNAIGIPLIIGLVCAVGGLVEIIHLAMKSRRAPVPQVRRPISPPRRPPPRT